jgi:cytochrome b561
MGWRNTRFGYGTGMVALHWLMTAMFIGAYATTELREYFPKDSPGRAAIMAWHYTIGLSILILAMARLGLRSRGERPEVRPAPGRWESAAAAVVHWALYGVMIGAPVLGWMVLSAEGKPLTYFGLELPPLLGKDKDLGEWFEELHETVGNAGYFLIGLHAAAALYHHYIRRDNTLGLILPQRRGS